ncbi:phospholipase [Candidatus Fermentibacteria bacterium]|nr:phospholipase [Candidatus Fermentibacteria bacterium]
MATDFVTGRQIYERMIREAIPAAEDFVWIATADLKDLHVAKTNRMVPFLETLSDLIERGVAVRLVHAKEPGPAFREDFDRYPALIEGLERMLCPRVHFKTVVVDGRIAYCGSANLTGAGMGAKSDHRRNFEAGFITTEASLVQAIMDQFDELWMGSHCPECGRTEYCAEFHDLI